MFFFVQLLIKLLRDFFSFFLFYYFYVNNVRLYLMSYCVSCDYDFYWFGRNELLFCGYIDDKVIYSTSASSHDFTLQPKKYSKHWQFLLKRTIVDDVKCWKMNWEKCNSLSFFIFQKNTFDQQNFRCQSFDSRKRKKLNLWTTLNTLR